MKKSSAVQAENIVYLLASACKTRTYIGLTQNIEQRLRQHNGELSGGAIFTRGSRPWSPVLTIGGFPSRKLAAQMECRIKRTPFTGQLKATKLLPIRRRVESVWKSLINFAAGAALPKKKAKSSKSVVKNSSDADSLLLSDLESIAIDSAAKEPAISLTRTSRTRARLQPSLHPLTVVLMDPAVRRFPIPASLPPFVSVTTKSGKLLYPNLKQATSTVPTDDNDADARYQAEAVPNHRSTKET